MTWDWSIFFGVGGIIVSIAVGVITYILSTRKLRRHRYLTAKGMVVQQLAWSLGENNVPNRTIIRSTMRSVLRELGYDQILSMSEEDIIDDLLRQVTSDPFLEAARRQELQDKIQDIGAEKAAVFEVKKRIPELSALFSGAVATIVAGTTIVILFQEFFDWLIQYDLVVSGLTVIGFIFASVIMGYWLYRDFQKRR